MTDQSMVMSVLHSDLELLEWLPGNLNGPLVPFHAFSRPQWLRDRLGYHMMCCDAFNYLQTLIEA